MTYNYFDIIIANIIIIITIFIISNWIILKVFHALFKHYFVNEQYSRLYIYIYIYILKSIVYKFQGSTEKEVEFRELMQKKKKKNKKKIMV